MPPDANGGATSAAREDRLSRVESSEFDSRSLVGSWFHSDATRGWQGCVVAEVAPATYLVEALSWIDGTSVGQTLVSLEDMEASGWAFYDTATWMKNAYERGGVHERWERERSEAAPPA